MSRCSCSIPGGSDILHFTSRSIIGSPLGTPVELPTVFLFGTAGVIIVFHVKFTPRDLLGSFLYLYRPYTSWGHPLFPCGTPIELLTAFIFGTGGVAFYMTNTPLEVLRVNFYTHWFYIFIFSSPGPPLPSKRDPHRNTQWFPFWYSRRYCILNVKVAWKVFFSL